MSEEQKKIHEGFQRFCGGMPCGEMMQKMLKAEKTDPPFNCAEMMSQMMQGCCGKKEKKEESKENPVYNP